jgi:hypothetical protein
VPNTSVNSRSGAKHSRSATFVLPGIPVAVSLHHQFYLITFKISNMKTIKFISIAIFAVLFISCSKNSDTATPAAPSVAEQKSMVVSTSWRVNFFTERGTDKTSDLAGYYFQFNSNGTLDATLASTVFSGTWNLTQTNTKPDDSGHNSAPENKMNILVAGNKQMDEISEDWKILKLTSSEMWLSDDNLTSPKEIHFVKQ